MAKPPSRAQIRYLDNLGYDGERPRSMGEASAALDVMIDGGGSAAAQHALREERRLESAEFGSGCATPSAKGILGATVVVMVLCAGALAFIGGNKPVPVRVEPAIDRPVRREPAPKIQPGKPDVADDNGPMRFERGRTPPASREPRGPTEPSADEVQAQKKQDREREATAASESRAAARLKSAKSLLTEGKVKEAAKWLKRILDDEPDTEAAKEAKEIMRKTPGIPSP